MEGVNTQSVKANPNVAQQAYQSQYGPKASQAPAPNVGQLQASPNDVRPTRPGRGGGHGRGGVVQAKENRQLATDVPAGYQYPSLGQVVQNTFGNPLSTLASIPTPTGLFGQVVGGLFNPGSSQASGPQPFVQKQPPSGGPTYASSGGGGGGSSLAGAAYGQGAGGGMLNQAMLYPKNPMQPPNPNPFPQPQGGGGQQTPGNPFNPGGMATKTKDDTSWPTTPPVYTSEGHQNYSTNGGMAGWNGDPYQQYYGQQGGGGAGLNSPGALDPGTFGYSPNLMPGMRSGGGGGQPAPAPQGGGGRGGRGGRHGGGGANAGAGALPPAPGGGNVADMLNQAARYTGGKVYDMPSSVMQSITASGRGDSFNNIMRALGFVPGGFNSEGGFPSSYIVPMNFDFNNPQVQQLLSSLPPEDLANIQAYLGSMFNFNVGGQGQPMVPPGYGQQPQPGPGNGGPVPLPQPVIGGGGTWAQNPWAKAPVNYGPNQGGLEQMPGVVGYPQG